MGITNVVASSGTSLTVEQIRLIRKFSNNVTIIYDGDGAGIKAALRGIDLVLKEGMNVKVVLLPDGQDPDDFARRHTLDEVQEYIRANERDFVGFKTDLLLDEAGNDPVKRANLINDIADTIALMPDAVVRAVYVRSSAERFGIDEHILSVRINKTRSEMLIAEKKQRDREAQRESSSAVPDWTPSPADVYVDVSQPEYQSPVMPVGPIRVEYPYLEACEKELLSFVLENGCTELEFDRDSKYYTEERVTVADFIDGTLAEGDLNFLNSSYEKTYEAYFEMYQEGLMQQQIQQRMLNSMDEEIAAVAKEILIEKYQITVRNYEQSMTASATRLVIYVPKSLIAYQCRRVDLQIKEKMEALASSDDQISLLTEINSLNKVRTMLNNELGRV